MSVSSHPRIAVEFIVTIFIFGFRSCVGLHLTTIKITYLGNNTLFVDATRVYQSDYMMLYGW